MPPGKYEVEIEGSVVGSSVSQSVKIVYELIDICDPPISITASGWEA